MRDILFRAKPINGAEWVYGYIVKHGECWQIYTGTTEIVLGYFDEYGLPLSRAVKYVVDKETVCQYTGITDKNGKKIFEGDILEVFGIRGRVVQECGAFGLYFPHGINYERLEIEIPHNNYPYFCYADNYISLWELWWNYEQDDNPLYCAEIIGNVYENEELLEAEP